MHAFIGVVLSLLLGRVLLRRGPSSELAFATHVILNQKNPFQSPIRYICRRTGSNSANALADRVLLPAAACPPAACPPIDWSHDTVHNTLQLPESLSQCEGGPAQKI